VRIQWRSGRNRDSLIVSPDPAKIPLACPFLHSMVGKRMELLKEVMPRLQRVAIIANPGHAGQQSELRESQAAAAALGLTLEYFQVRTEAELDKALAALPKVRSEASVVFPDAFTMGFSSQIATAAAATRIPAISGWAQF